MEITDFEYDGQMLSDFDCVVCEINNSTNGSTISIGNQLSWNSNINNCSSIRTLTSSTYNSVFSCSFEIAKNPCRYENNPEFSDLESRQIMKWLNKRTWHKFRVVYDNNFFSSTYYIGSFNVQAIIINNNIIGFELTFESNAPFGYADDIIIEKDFNVNEEFYVFTTSDEIGNIYPNIKFYINSNGTLIFNNKSDNSNTIIKNCISGEIISIDGTNKIIRSNIEHKNLFNDFNFVFPKLITDNKSDENIISFTSIPCKLEMSYTPIRKIGVIV